MRTRLPTFRSVALVLLVACGGGGDGGAVDTHATDDGGTRPGTLGGVHYAFEDEGRACLQSPDDGGLVADVAGEVQVELGCVPCFPFLEASSCEAVLDGSVLTVHASATVHVEEDTSITCTCAPITLYCEMPALPAGSYTLSYGSGEVAFEVPAADLVCVDG